MALAAELASTPVLTVGLDVDAATAARTMRDESIGDLVVVDASGRVVGMLTDRDMAIRVIADGRDAKTTKVEEICSRPAITLPASAFVKDAERVMREHLVHRLPLVDEEQRPLGIISLEDLAASGYVDDAELRRVIKEIGAAYRRRTSHVLHGH